MSFLIDFNSATIIT